MTNNTASAFYADYDGKYSYINGKRKPVGHYAAVLANHNIELLVSAREYAEKLKEQLAFLSSANADKLDIDGMKDTTLHIIDVLWNYEPFSLFDITAEKDKIAKLFSDSEIVDCIAAFDTIRYLWHDEIEEAIAIMKANLNAASDDILKTLPVYADAVDDMTMFTFVRRAFDKHILPSSPKRDAVTLYSRALDFYKTQQLQALSFRASAVEGRTSVDMFVNTETEFVTLTQKKKSGSITVCARRIYFHSVIDFLMYDFLEGLRLGHYPVVCGVCGRSFLMMNAHTRRYCNGYAPKEICDGRRLTCRQVAAKQGRAAREKSADHPVKDIYARRLNTINKQLERGTITPEFGKTVKRLAKDKMQRALSDNEYFRRDYAKEMKQDALYAEAKGKQ